MRLKPKSDLTYSHDELSSTGVSFSWYGFFICQPLCLTPSTDSSFAWFLPVKTKCGLNWARYGPVSAPMPALAPVYELKNNKNVT